jgi:hypothetical protein
MGRRLGPAVAGAVRAALPPITRADGRITLPAPYRAVLTSRRASTAADPAVPPS